MTDSSTELARAKASLQNSFIGDSLAMPVHWYYNPADIWQQFPGGISKFENASEFHPGSIMSLHSTQQGGRTSVQQSAKKEVVGDIILKGKRQYWNQANVHYHQGMKAGENTLNAHCARVVMRSLVATDKQYDADHYLASYIELMTSEKPQHPDTYAESYHRGFFANYAQGIEPIRCAALTHDTASIGGLVTIGPLAICRLLNGDRLRQVQTICRAHLLLTHPDDSLAKICDDYVALIERLLMRDSNINIEQIVAATADNSIGLNLPNLLRRGLSDMEVVGGLFTSACYISGSWPSILYFLAKYYADPIAGLTANTNVGGDNVHRGSVLGLLLGLVQGATIDSLYNTLRDHKVIDNEIDALLDFT